MLEHEARWTNDLPDEPERFEPLLGELGLEVLERRTVDLADVYFDDADGSLRAAGIGLRLRRSAEESAIEWKRDLGADPGIDRRDERSVPVDTGFSPHSAADLPGELRDLVEPFVGTAPLTTVTTIRNERTLWTLRHVLSGAAAELAFDRFIAERRGEAIGPFGEIELEWRSGGDEIFREIAILIAGRAGLLPAGASKLERALTGAGAGPQKKDEHTETAISPAAKDAAIGIHACRLAAAEADLRCLDDADAVHDLRVAARRMRAHLRFAAADHAAQDVRTLERLLTESIDRAGRVRDLDICLALLGQSGAAHDRAAAVEDEALVRHVERERTRSARALRKVILDPGRIDRRRNAVRRIRNAAAAHVRNSADESDRERSIDVRVLGALVVRYRRMRRAFERAAERRLVPEWHRARKKGRAVRYLLEESKDRLPRAARRFLRLLRAHLDLLGRLQDLSSCRDRLAAIAASESRAPARAKAAAARHAVIFWNEIDTIVQEIEAETAPFNEKAGPLFAAAVGIR